MDFNYVVLPALLVLAGLLIGWIGLHRIRSLRSRSYSAERKLSERVVLSLVAVVSIAVAASSGINAILLHHFRKSPPGTIYQVNGRGMRMDCVGSGSPTIVLDSGLGNDGLIWDPLQPVLAKTTRVCSYDRAGYGWSDPGPAPRDADNIANELHALLQTAQIAGPMVLMGHSMSGIYMRAFASRYPMDLAGLIFVDSSTPWQNRNPAFEAVMVKSQPNWIATLQSQLIYSVGIPRLRGTCSRALPGFDAETGRLEAESQCHLSFATIAGEGENFDRSGSETIHSGPFGDLPILILSQDPAKSVGEDAELGTAWNRMQEDLKSLSTRSRRIIAKNSSHYVFMDRADLIEEEVPRFIEQIRGTAPQPNNYGSTTVE